MTVRDRPASLPAPAQPPIPAMPNHAPTSQPAPQSKSKSKGGGWVWILFLCIAAGCAYAGWSFIHSQDTAKAGKNQNREIPVQASPVVRGDFKLFLNGLGTVTSLNTVTLHTRIDGQIMKIGFTEGQDVKEGDELIEIDPRPYEVALSQAEGQLAKDSATLDNAKLDLTRFQNAGEAIPEQQLATGIAAVAQDQGAVKVDQGQVDNAKLNLVYCHITAPITGRVGLRLVDVGNMVHASDTTGLLVITQIKPITVIFTLAEDDLPKVLKAKLADSQLAVEAWDREFKNKLTNGTLLAIDSQIDPTTATIRLRAVFPNDDGMLYPNQFVNIRLLVDTRQGVTLAPSAAIQHNTRGSFVYVVKPDNSVEIRTVTAGPSEGSQTVVEKGLQPDEVVVTDGVDKLQNGSKVSMRTPDAAKTK